MSTFLEDPKFADDLSYWAVGGAAYKTTVTPFGSGFEARVGRWTYPLCAFDLQNVLRTYTADAQVASLMRLRNFFHVMRGQLYGFRFRDWTDFLDDGIGILGVTGKGDGATVAFQMFKNYTLGSGGGAMSTLRLIRKPRTGDAAFPLTFYVSGVLTAVTLDSTTGIATFAAAPANNAPLTWKGPFDVPARFNNDNFQATPDTSGLYVIQQLGVMETRA